MAKVINPAEKVTMIVWYDLIVKQELDSIEREFREFFSGRSKVSRGKYQFRFNIKQLDKERKVQRFLKVYKGRVEGKLCKKPIEEWPR